MCKDKENFSKFKPYVNAHLYHALQLLGLTPLLLLLFYKNPIRIFIYSLLIAFFHLIVDIIKSLIKKKGLVEIGVFLFDQVIHLIIIFALWNRFDFTNNNYFVSVMKNEINRSGSFVDSTFVNAANFSYLLTVVIIITYVCWGGDILISKTLKAIFNKNTNHTEEKVPGYLAVSGEGTRKVSIELKSAFHEASATTDNINKENNEKVGRYIGILERVIIMVLVVTNSVSSIVFVLTAKSVARFKELGETKLSAEYYLIGTLLSTLIALVGGFFIKNASL